MGHSWEDRQLHLSSQSVPFGSVLQLRCLYLAAVTKYESHTPVGSGRFREQTRDAEAVPGLSLSLLIQHLPPDVSLLCREHPLLQVSLLHFLGSRPFFSSTIGCCLFAFSASSQPFHRTNSEN